MTESYLAIYFQASTLKRGPKFIFPYFIKFLIVSVLGQLTGHFSFIFSISLCVGSQRHLLAFECFILPSLDGVRIKLSTRKPDYFTPEYEYFLKGLRVLGYSTPLIAWHRVNSAWLYINRPANHRWVCRAQLTRIN